MSAPRLSKIWNIPEYGHRDATLLDVFADVLAADRTSRLTKRLVYDEQIATSVNAFAGASEIAGRFTVTVTGKPGADMVRIERIVDEEMGRLIAEGPTASELEKVRARERRGDGARPGIDQHQGHDPGDRRDVPGIAGRLETRLRSPADCDRGRSIAPQHARG